MRTLYLATTNPDKVREVQELLRGTAVRVAPLDLAGVPEPDETGDTFEENARLKARYYAAHAPGPVVAEDSGLEIDALGGEPGVRSARYLGPDATYDARFVSLLQRLRDVPDSGRSARFVCALAVVDAGQVVFETRGTVEGRIARAPAGDGGFGYDPIFFYPPLDATLAAVGPQKAAVSHRGQAVRALARWLGDLKYAQSAPDAPDRAL